MMKRLIFIWLFYQVCLLIYGQATSEPKKERSECLAGIKEADRLYQAGIYDGCIDILEEILKTCTLSGSEKLRAMELTAKAFIEADDMGKAETTVHLMLVSFPNYDLKEPDNSESFNRLVKKFKVHPQFSLGIRNTAAWRRFNSTKTFSVLDGLDYSVPYSKQGFGILQGFDLMYYGWAEFEFDRDISVNGDLIFMWTKFNRNFTKAPGFNLSYWEADNYVEIPVYVKRYFHPWKNVLTYVTAGTGWRYMTKASGNATISYTKDDIITGKNIDFFANANNIDMLEMRNRHTFEWIAGTGIGYKLKNLRLFLDARYYGGINSFTNPEKGFSNSMLVNDFYYVDNRVKLNQFEIGASISYTFINSVKRIKR